MLLLLVLYRRLAKSASSCTVLFAGAEVAHTLSHRFFAVEFTDVVLQSAGTVAKGARSQKRNHRHITGILICKYHRELTPSGRRSRILLSHAIKVLLQPLQKWYSAAK